MVQVAVVVVVEMLLLLTVMMMMMMIITSFNLYLLIFLNFVFRFIRIVVKSAYYLCHVRLSICLSVCIIMHVSAWPLTEQTSIKFDIEKFYDYTLKKPKFC